MQWRRQRLVITVLLILILINACSKNQTVQSGNEKISIYTSFYVMYDFTEKIGGDKVNVVNMVPAGMEPHEWEPSPRDVAGLTRADVFVYNGAGLEGWVDKVLQSINSQGLYVVETSRDIKLMESTGHRGHEAEEYSHDHPEYDPHVWLDPMNAKKQMELIKDALIHVDPTNKNFYESNYEKYAKKLDDLDDAYHTETKTFSRKHIIVNHEAFGYLCSTYGLEQIALEGVASESEPTLAKMAEIIRIVKEYDVQTIFFEELASPKVAEAIARETGTQTAVLNPLGGLTEASLRSGKDYFSIMEDNLQALKQALQ